MGYKAAINTFHGFIKRLNVRSVNVIDFLVFLGEGGGGLCPSLTLIGDDPPYPCKMKYLTSLLSTVTG